MRVYKVGDEYAAENQGILVWFTNKGVPYSVEKFKELGAKEISIDKISFSIAGNIIKALYWRLTK